MKYLTQVGYIVEKIKTLEMNFDDIIINYTHPQHNKKFMRDILLNSQIISIGHKITILKNIFSREEINFNFENLHKLIITRNLIAHQSSYAEISDKELIWKIDEIKNNGQYIQSDFEEKYNQFEQTYKLVYSEIMKIKIELAKKYNIQLANTHETTF